MIPRCVEYLFERIAQKSDKTDIAVFSSFLEIYNDQIRDLGKAYLVATGIESSSSSALYEKTSDIFESLEQKRNQSYFAPAFRKSAIKSLPNESPMKSSMNKSFGTLASLKEVQDEYKEIHYEIYEDSEGNVFVKDLSIIPVQSSDEVFQVLQYGLKLRATHETKMNTVSSRSHCVFSLTVLQRDRSTNDAIKGTINLVDLAGSERVKKSESVGMRLREALHINTSLTALGKVIMALDPSSENTHIPYRDSKLTRILQNTLSGNSYTTLLATIHPSPTYFEECLSTLQFANRCRNVRNHPRVNYIGETEDKDKKIKRLLEEINQLRAKLNMYESRLSHSSGSFTPAMLVSVLQKLGVKAELGQEGEMIVNGQVISTAELGLSDLQTHEGSDSVHHQQELVKEIARFKQNLKEQKELIQNLRSENEEYRLQLSNSSAQVHNSNNELKLMRVQYERALDVFKMSIAQEYEKKIKSIVDHNEYLLKQRIEAQNQIKIQADGIRLSSIKSTQFIGREEYADRIEDALKSKSLEVALIQKQYEDFRVDLQRAFDSELQEISKKMDSAKLIIKDCEKEIYDLYKYAVHLESLLGRYNLLSGDAAPESIHSNEMHESTAERFKLTHRIASSFTKRTLSGLLRVEDPYHQMEESNLSFVDKMKGVVQRKSSQSKKSRPQSASPQCTVASTGAYSNMMIPRPQSALSTIVTRSKPLLKIGAYYTFDFSSVEVAMVPDEVCDD